jgi:hypothetical protein
VAGKVLDAVAEDVAVFFGWRVWQRLTLSI